MSMFFLIGMPGSGKSYWAYKVAEQYNMGVIDLDTYIEQREQTTIPDLFSQRGEAGFRDAEHEALKEIIKQDAEYTIIACGGGTPCFHNNLYMMKQAGIVVYLQASIPYLLKQIQAGHIERPLLQGSDNAEARLQELLTTRETVYLQADYILPTESISLPTFAEITKPTNN